MTVNLTARVYGRDVDRDGWPTVAVVMPVRNEENHLENSVKAVLAQDYPIPFQICLAVGPSDDRTASVADLLAATYESVGVVANPTGVTPAALNAAIAATDSDIVVRVDGHSALSDGYIRTAVETMIEQGAVNVGGIQHPVGTTPFEKAVAVAMTSRLGTGGAKFHVGGAPGPVDTVYLGVFDRSAGDKVGWFDERLIRNQDYELNIRLREAGGTVWFTPELQVTYTPRSTWLGLAKQYFEYGYWKAQVLRLHPGSLRLRQLIPALAAPLAVVTTAMAVRLRALRIILLAGAAAGAVVSIRMTPRAAVAVATQIIAWSVGFWNGVVRGRGNAGSGSSPTRATSADPSEVNPLQERRN